ncbi:hypothetical protein [Pseudomonas putida]|uniref:hypothetical protein n=1 Tax=Pseudomonas putida TaxID=303 RepID=UPI003D3334D0
MARWPLIFEARDLPGTAIVYRMALGRAVSQGDIVKEGDIMVIEHVPNAVSVLSSILSIAASIKSLQLKFNLSPKEALKRFLGKASQADKDLLSQPGIKEAVVELTVISKELLEQLSREAKECEKKHIEARQATEDLTSKEVADIRGSGCMCSILRSIKRHNGMNLPKEGPFNNWWVSYNCD